MPNLRSPRSASPESFSRTRLYFGSIPAESRPRSLAEREALEALDGDVLADRCGERRHQVLDRLRRVADVGLPEQLVDGLRVHRRDLHRDLLGELLEVVAARDEVGLARDLHDRPLAAVRVDVRRDDALARLA